MNQCLLSQSPFGIRNMYRKVIPDVIALGLKCGPIALLNLVNRHFPSRTGKSLNMTLVLLSL